MNSALFLLKLPSAAILVALGVHLARRDGRMRAARFLGAAALYGVIRWLLVSAISRGHFGTATPYLMAGDGPHDRPAPQELLGWTVAAGYAWLGARRLLARLGVGAGPGRTAALAALFLAAICYAVESAAIRAGWWSWTLAAGGGSPFVPPIALVDWAFVAFDFLAPYLAFRLDARRAVKLAACALLPLHFLSHLWVKPLAPDLPLTGFDLAHVAIALGVALGGLLRESAAPAPENRREFVPAAGLAVIALSSAAAILLSGGGVAALAALPLGLLALAALPGRGRAVAPEPAWARRALAGGLLAAAGALLLFSRVPAQEERGKFEALARAAAGELARGDLAAAERDAGALVGLRPDKSVGRNLLALVALKRGENDLARARLDESLAVEPYNRDALYLAILLDLAAGRRERIGPLAERAVRAYPDRGDFAWAAAFARGEAGPGMPAHEPSIALAGGAGTPACASLAKLAAAAGDAATAARCGPGR